MVQASNLGYPRIGSKRELKHALEQFWSGQRSETELLEQYDAISQAGFLLQVTAPFCSCPARGVPALGDDQP